MNKEKLGQEPAFPELTTEYDGVGNVLPYQNKGMSKRFYAACAAMQGLLANEGLIIALSKEYPKGADYSKIRRHYTIMAYEYADELLKQENE